MKLICSIFERLPAHWWHQFLLRPRPVCGRSTLFTFDIINTEHVYLSLISLILYKNQTLIDRFRAILVNVWGQNFKIHILRESFNRTWCVGRCSSYRLWYLSCINWVLKILKILNIYIQYFQNPVYTRNIYMRVFAERWHYERSMTQRNSLCQ